MSTFLIIVLTLIILLIWFYLLYKITTRTRLLILPASLVFIVSFCLYFYGFWTTNPNNEIVPIIINSVIDGILLFLGSDGFWKHPEINNLLYNYCLNLCLAMSVSVSISFIVSAFGTRIKARARALSINGESDLHLFFGITSRAITLAKDIDKSKGEKDKIVFVDIPENINNGQEASLSFFDILSNFLTISPKAHKIIDKTKYWILSIPKNDKINKLEETKISNLFHDISLTVKKGHDVTFYVMSDDLERNAQLTFDLANDIQSIITGEKFNTAVNKSILKILKLNHRSPFIAKSFLFILKANKKYTILSKAINAINKVLLNLSILDSNALVRIDRFKFNREIKPTIYTIIKRSSPYKNIDILFPEVDIICLDPAYLSVQLLKKGLDEDVHPIDYMEIAKDKEGNSLGYVNTNFSAMVIGFGSTGSNVIPFIYEFAAVPDEDGKQARYKCYVIDDRLDYLEGNYTINRPSVDFSSKISFQDIKPDSDDFWKFVKDRIDELNYIVICLGDDGHQLKLATDLIKFAYIQRKNSLKNFVVLIRLYGEDNSLIVDAINSFNNRYYSSIHRNVLIPFGRQKDIFCYDLIHELKFHDKAKQIFNYENDDIRRASNSSEEDKYKDWNDRHFVWKRLCEDPKDTPLKMKDHEIMEKYWHKYSQTRLNEIQNISSTYFIHTIKTLSKRKDKKIPKVVLEKLAISEHLRKRASLEMSGYRYGESDEHVKMTSPELTDWNNLKDSIKEIHYSIVEASLKDN